MNIFLAEDDEDDALFFKEVLSELLSNADLTIFTNGEKLMNQLYMNELLPDIIFLDLNMPRKNGFECLKEIKSNSSLKAIKTIILSTTSDEVQIKKCNSLGADMFLTKVNSYNKFKLILMNCFSI